MSTADDQPRRERPRFRETALASTLVDEAQLAAAEASLAGVLDRLTAVATDWDQAVADRLVQEKILTPFQAREMLAGRKRFRLGQYTVLDEVARGGMGQVFRAEHAMMGREVAVKVLPRAKSTPDSEAAFRREMRMLGRLDHENLVRAYDAGYDAMVYYLVTELVPGLDLKRQVQKHGPLDEVTAASVISQAARGLAYAHEQGLVHRDVKPGNLLVMPDGRVKVLDLGLAGSQIEEESSRLGRVVGTMDYIAPEQIRMPDDVGPSADIYALGCTLYFAVTGQVPFPGGTRREKMQRHLSATPVPVAELAPHLSADFCRVIEAMMARNPAERIKSAGDVAERLRRWSPAVPPAMPRKGGAAKSERSAGEPPPLPDEQPHSLGWLTRWARQDTPQPRAETTTCLGSCPRTGGRHRLGRGADAAEAARGVARPGSYPPVPGSAASPAGGCGRRRHVRRGDGGRAGDRSGAVRQTALERRPHPPGLLGFLVPVRGAAGGRAWPSPPLIAVGDWHRGGPKAAAKAGHSLTIRPRGRTKKGHFRTGSSVGRATD